MQASCCEKDAVALCRWRTVDPTQLRKQARQVPGNAYQDPGGGRQAGIHMYVCARTSIPHGVILQRPHAQQTLHERSTYIQYQYFPFAFCACSPGEAVIPVNAPASPHARLQARSTYAHLGTTRRTKTSMTHTATAAASKPWVTRIKRRGSCLRNLKEINLPNI